jgi:hypothetical protein
MSEENKQNDEVATPLVDGVVDVNHAAESVITPADQPELPPQVEVQNELIRQSVEALTNFSDFR